jgi:hypothetical protein
MNRYFRALMIALLLLGFASCISLNHAACAPGAQNEISN